MGLRSKTTFAVVHDHTNVHETFPESKKKGNTKSSILHFFSYNFTLQEASGHKSPMGRQCCWNIAQGRRQMDPHLFVGSMVQVPKMRNLLIAVLVNLKALFNFDNFKRIQARIITTPNQSNFRLFSAVKKAPMHSFTNRVSWKASGYDVPVGTFFWRSLEVEFCQ